jgi:RNA polymerase sigma factor (sigma-70 family)
VPSSPATKVMEHLCTTALRGAEGLSDGQLLDSYIRTRDEVAFATLVRRHGPMVWGVCQRIVGQAEDAEDAFQATFLVLVRKAAAVKPLAAIGNWLHGVARRTALKARTTAAKVRAKQLQVMSMPEPAEEGKVDRHELQLVLDQELGALPDKYRLAVVLCDLEGRTRKEVAAQLKIPLGTLSSRLATAHQMLAKRLARHGLGVSAGSLAGVLAQNATAAVPTAVVLGTIKTASLVAAGQATAGIVSAKVVALTEGVLRAMLLTKLKTALTGLLVLGVLAFSYGIIPGGQTDPASQQSKQAANENDKPRSIDPGMKNDNAWHPLKKGELLAVDVERCLYEVKGEKRFLIAVRLTNVTKGEVGVDWQAPRPRLYPNQWGVHDTKQRGIVDEKRAVHAPADRDKVRADFRAGRLTRIPAGKSIIVWTEFNSSGRADVDAGQGKYFIVSMDGQFCTTDGTTVDTISCEWKNGVGAKETDVVLPFPLTWKTTKEIPAGAKPNRWEKLLQDKNLTAKQRSAYEQIAKLRTIKLDSSGWGSISVPSFVKDSKLATDLLFAMGLDVLPMLAEALDDEAPTATVITQREGDFKQEKVWKVNDFAALLIVRIADRDFVIGELPKYLGIRDIAERPKAALEFRKMVVAWHGKFATKTQTERKIADVTDPWFRNRFDAIIWFGQGKVNDGRAPIVARVDAFYADKNREYSSLTRAEMSHCSLALGQIGDKADLPPVRKVCKDISYWLETYGIQGSQMLEDLFRSYQGLVLLGEKDAAIQELERLFAAHGAKFEESAKKEYAERLKAAKGEAP